MIHRIVAEAFISRPDGKTQINHIDGNKTNNRVDNLEWCTQSENMRHRVDVLGIRPASHHIVRVRCIETGRVFRSAAEASRSVGLSRGGIGAALRKSYTTCFREEKIKSYQRNCWRLSLGICIMAMAKAEEFIRNHFNPNAGKK